MFPDKEPSYWRWGRWCWHKPRYFGIPLSLGIFILCFIDLAYLIYWWVKNWGVKNEAK